MQERKPLQRNAKAKGPPKLKADIIESERPALSAEKRKRLNASLWDAALWGKNRKIRKLLEAGANVNARDHKEKTALMHAAMGRRRDTCYLLVENGANIGAKDKNGWTALMWAAYYESTDSCAFLLGRGASINARSENGDTALGIAEKNESKETAEYLRLYAIRKVFGMVGTENFLPIFRKCIG